MHTPELVVLVNEHDEPIGTLPKSEVHQDHTPLHRAFSCFIFDRQGNILLQQRALHKKTRPGVWSNSFCGHPLPEESYKKAVERRALYELGISLPGSSIQKISDYRYCFTRDGVMENEICPIFASIYQGTLEINSEEIEAYQRIQRGEWLTILQNDLPGDQGNRSERCKQEALLVDALYRKKTFNLSS